MTSKMGGLDNINTMKINPRHQTNPSAQALDQRLRSLFPDGGHRSAEVSGKKIEPPGSLLKAEEVSPHHYKVYLADYDVVAEVSPTEQAAHFRFTFPDQASSYILLDAFKGGSMVKIIPEERKIIGYCRNNSGGVPDNFHNYFVVPCSTKILSFPYLGDKWALKAPPKMKAITSEQSLDSKPKGRAGERKGSLFLIQPEQADATCVRRS